MEFFIIADVAVDEKKLQNAITIANIERFCESIVLLQQTLDTATIGSSWGEFELSRQTINGGLRFALTTCPNALSWTITTGYPPDPDRVVIHLALNRKEKSAEFVQSILDFGNEWRDGLEAGFP
ncbi:hypothetical protein KKI24_29720 [bacterium]|nr:hypothetical protein [bacterium]